MSAVLLSAAIGATVGWISVYNIAKSNGAEGWKLFGWTMAGIAGGWVIDGALVVGVRALVTKATGSGYYLVFDETYDKML